MSSSLDRPSKRVIGVLVSLMLGIMLPSVVSANPCTPFPPYYSPHDRFGFNVMRDHGKVIDDYSNSTKLNGSWYLDYGANRSTQPLGFAPVIRLSDLQGTWQRYVGSLVDANPSFLWVIGNEPDRHGQDALLPLDFAKVYHDAYYFIKDRDPSSQVAIAPVVQGSAVRLAYLDRMLDHYKAEYGEDLPTDMWNLHGFILNEVLAEPYGVWGAGLPPGMRDSAHLASGRHLTDHGDVEIFKQQIIDFRKWMAENGYRATPLIMSEFGILFGQGTYIDAQGSITYDEQFVRQYMKDTFDFLLGAIDKEIGNPADGHRLVQAWSWYSMNDYLYSYPDRQDGFNGNLLDHDSGALTAFGQDFKNYIAQNQLIIDYTDIDMRTFDISPAIIEDPDQPETITLTTTLVNRGSQGTNAFRVEFWDGNPVKDGVKIGEKTISSVTSRCQASSTVSLAWKPDSLSTGRHTIYVRIISTGETQEFDLQNNYLARTVEVGSASPPPPASTPIAVEDPFPHSYLPRLER